MSHEIALVRGCEVSEDEMWRLRFEHAWRFFQTHAQQRLTNFQFAVTVIAAIYALLAAAEQYKLASLAAAGCATGIGASFLFWLTDRRNRRLVKASEVDLKSFEAKVLAADAAYRGPLQVADEGSLFLFRYSALNALFFLLNIVVFSWILYLENRVAVSALLSRIVH